MVKTLHISDDLTLPIDAVTQQMACLGRKGGGKTYCATKIAEEMLDAGAQIICLDPVGKWYGLRLPGTGAHGKGFDVPVFGGLNGDVPLEPHAGKLIADLVVDRGISAILDVSQFILSEQTRFAKDFITQFYQRKKAAPSAVHLFIEECQEFVPQNIPKGQEGASLMLHGFERVVKLGRNCGIGITLISQRPQEVNKKALNQTECMFAFQMTGPQERKAIESWVAEKGVDEDVKEILPRLPQGHARVWSPIWLREFKTILIAEKRSADVSATPKVGAKAQTIKPLTPIDLKELEAAMKDTVERAKENDPKELKKQIAELKRQASAKTPTPLRAIETIKEVEKPVLKDAQIKRLELFGGKLLSAGTQMIEVAKEITAAVAKVHTNGHRPGPRPAPAPRPVAPRQTAPAQTENRSDNENLSGPEQRVLDALAWWEAIGVMDPDKGQVGFIAGYRVGKNVGGTFGNILGRLRSSGLIDYPSAGAAALTDAGRAIANPPSEYPTTETLHEAIYRRLDGPERRVLEGIIESYPERLTKQDAGQRAGYTVGDNVGGTFGNILGRLRSLGLIDYPQPGYVVALPVLFLN